MKKDLLLIGFAFFLAIVGSMFVQFHWARFFVAPENVTPEMIKAVNDPTIKNMPRVGGNLIVDRDWNSNTEGLPDGKKKTTFNQGWVNYMDAIQSFQPIDTTIATATDGSFEMLTAPFEAHIPQFSNGFASFVSNNRYDPLTKTVITDNPITLTTRAENIGRVEGRIVTGQLIMTMATDTDVTYVEYPNAYAPNVDLIYYVRYGAVPSLDKLVRFRSNVASSSYSFIMQTDRDIERRTRLGTFNADGKLGKGEFLDLLQASTSPRMVRIKPVHMWDSNRNIVDVDTDIQLLLLRRIRLTKNIDPSFFTATTSYPVYTDTTTTYYPDNPTAKVDGEELGNTSNVWATQRGNASADGQDYTSASDNNHCRVGKTGTPSFAIGRGIYLFDTSAIPDTDTISSATFGMWVAGAPSNGDNDGDDVCHLVSSAPASETALALGDYSSLGSTDFGSGGDYTSLSSGAYDVITLNASGLANISKTATSKFGTREGHDLNNNAYNGTAPGNNLYLTNFVETAGTANDPYLTVVYVSAPTVDNSTCGAKCGATIVGATIYP
jgi:hypothetical protein